MTTQEKSSSPNVDRIVEAHDDTEGDSPTGYFNPWSAGKLSLALFSLSAVGALATGDVELGTGLVVVTVLFAGAFLAGARARQ